ncbi:MAG: ribonuclease R [Proteobacteria bacterium]|nr:ribonuclease R [Pseudomonadota bacterium]MBU1716910.1 ribonuclease R [Pseudomonadota bacterium]
MARRKFSGRKSSSTPRLKKRRSDSNDHRGKSRRLQSGNSQRSREHKTIDDEIIGFIFANKGEASFQEISASFGAKNISSREIENLLSKLCHSKILSCSNTNYRLNRQDDLVEGTIFSHPRGFGFVTPLATGNTKIDQTQDIFVPARAMGSATHGDRVLLRITGSRRGKMEAIIIRILERVAGTVVGIYMDGNQTGLVIPEDEHFTFNILINKSDNLGAKNGEAVLAEITDYREEQSNPAGRVIEVLGDPDDLDVQTEIVIRKHKLPHEFTPKALAQTDNLDPAIKPEANRVDLRKVLHVTIDGETARDFDDAVALIKTRAGYKLYVSIADVSHYVTPSSPLDIDAYTRGTSVYFPNRVIPMLPERLSNNLCSLVPNEDRPAFTAIIDFDLQGKKIGKSFTKSIICSQHRLTYTIVKQILVDREPELCKKYKDILTPLKWMGDLAAKLEKIRMARGSIGFEIPETAIKIGPDQKVEAIARTERNLAHKLIEEFMLAANEAVAETFTEKGVENSDFLYRIHEQPDPLKVEEFADFARKMGLNIPREAASPKWFGKVLAMVSGTPREYIVSNLLLRAMKQACYSPDNAGHFGLAAENYTHFTSPIRRYPDLMVHRALNLLISPKEKANKNISYKSASEAGIFLSKRERVSVEAEREMTERISVRYMAQRIYQSFDGIVSGVSNFGMFVELLDSFISGGVAITDMKDDYYHLDEKNHRLVGKLTNKIFQIGDLITVQVISVDIKRRRINFIVENKVENEKRNTTETR